MSDLFFSVGRTASLKDKYHVVVIGGGPAGLTAALYASRALLSTAVISEDFGGQILDAHLVENYPGILEATGAEIGQLFRKHAEKFGAEMVQAKVLSVKREGEEFVVETDRGTTRAPVVILATGSRHRKLGVPGEELRGVSYCAICDAALFKGKTVAIVGGGNTALMDAELLTQHVSRLYLIHRRREFRGEPIYVERLRRNPKVEFVLPYVVEKREGEGRVEKIRIRNMETGEEKVLEVDGVFVDIGMEPRSEIARSLGAELDEKGYVKVDEAMATSVPGLFAAGDVTNSMNFVHQIVTAAAGGAIAATSAFNYLKSKGLV